MSPSSVQDPHGFQLLFERSGLPEFALPASLLDEYGGALGFERPCFFANLVASVDGVVAVPTGGESGKIISGHSQADRFVMGLLRACAQAVIVGAGTFRKSPGHLWTPSAIYPARASLFAEARQRLGFSPRPTLVLVTQSGDLDVDRPAVRDALVVTTPSGADALRARAPSLRCVVLGAERVRFTEVLALLHEQGLYSVLTEGGPSLLAEVVAEGVLDQLFLTSSPALFGRFPADQRKSLADGLDLAGAPLDLLSARRHGSHLFLRYALTRC